LGEPHGGGKALQLAFLISLRVARPTLVVEVDGEKTAGVVEQQR
jgi:hypothetical protein